MRLFHRSVGLKSYLAALTLIVLLPVGIVAAGALYLLWKNQEAQLLRSHRDLAQALAVAVDRELESTVQRAQLLARHPEIALGRLDSFAKFARAAQRESRRWANVALIDRSGQQLFNALSEDVRGLPNLGDRPYVREAFATGNYVVSNLVLARMPEEPFVVVAIPVVSADAVNHLVLVNLRLSSLASVLTQQVIPAGGVAAVIDREYRIVARSGKAAEYVGRQPVPALLAELNKGVEGTAEVPTLDGVMTYAAWARIPASNWWLAVGLPLQSTREALARHLALLSSLFGLIVIVALGLSYLLAARIAGTITAAAGSAAAVARGEPASLPSTYIRELNQLSDALNQASERLAEAEKTRAELLDRERRARTLAENASRVKDEFLAMLGHELRNPLAPIVTALALIKAKAGGRLAREEEIIARQVSHLTRLVDDLLDVSRLTRGKVQLNREPVELGEVVDDALETVSPLLEQRRHRVHMDVPRTGLLVYADRVRLAQIVANLLTNAGKYTPLSGDIYIVAERRGDDACVRVRDTGVGISPELLPHIFEIFFQGRTTDQAEGGLGIGLALVKNLVALHGGTVSAASPGEGQGSEFTIRLPLSDTSHDDGAAPRASGITAASPQHVVIVDDNRDAAELAAEMLRLAGHTVAIATSPLDALAMVEQTRPTVAVLDIGMPVMDGYELARRIKERLGRASPRLIALTGYGRDADRERAHRAGFDAHLAKPVDSEVLLNAVQQTGQHTT